MLARRNAERSTVLRDLISDVAFSTRYWGHTVAVTNSTIRWGAAAPGDPGRARDLLLDAAEACFERNGIGATTMDDIAKQAHVSRATVYRYFSGRDAVVSGVILRATERYLEKIQPRITGQPDLGGAVLEFVEVTIRAAKRDDTIGLLFKSDDHLAGIGFADGTSVALFEMVTEFLRPVFAAHWAQVRPGVSVDEASEWILRTILSLLTVRGPRDRSRDGLHALLQRLLLPAIVLEF